MLYNDFDKTVKKLLIDNDMQLKDVAEILNESQQNISNKLSRKTIRLVDAERILNAIGYKLVIQKKE